MLLQIVLRTLSRDHLEILVEAGEIGKAAFKTKLLNTDAIVN